MTHRLLPLLFAALLPFELTAQSLAGLHAERVASVVAVEFITATEIDRIPSTVYGTVIDREGRIMVAENAVSARVRPDQLEDFKIYPPGSSRSWPGRYLGQSVVSGWHFLQVDDPELRERLTPVTEYLAEGPVPGIGDEVWGIGLREKDENFRPYLLTGRVAMIQNLPMETAFSQNELATPGLPVFDFEGRLAGIATSPYGERMLLFSQRDRGTQIVLLNLNESGAFWTRREILPLIDQIPDNPVGRPIAWAGIYGLQPVDPEVARFLDIEEQGSVVVSEVLEGGPAEEAGLQDRDIILALDGIELPQYKPDQVLVGYLEREILKRSPGDTVTFTLLRGRERIEVPVVLADEPRTRREADREYFDRLGFSVREFLYLDAVSRRVSQDEGGGAVVNFVKPNSPAGTAGLRPEDWIREIDGLPVEDYQGAVSILERIAEDSERTEVVVLARRGSETSVLRVKLSE